MKRTILFASLACLALAMPKPSLAVEPYVWKSVATGGGGFVTGVVFSEAERDLAYARTDVGGAYRWDPVANQWIQLVNWIGYGQVSLSDVESIAPDPTDADRVYIVGGEGDITRLMRSTDRGATFQLIDPGFKAAGNGEGRSKGERLVVDPNSPNILFYGTRSQGLFKSTDRGSTWAKVAAFPVATTTDGVGITEVIFDTRNATPGKPTPTLYALVSQKGSSLYKSTDAGATWNVVAGTPAALQPIDAGLDTTGMLYISYADAPGPNGIGAGAMWKLNTNNGTWTNLNPPAGAGGFGGVGVDKKRPGTVMVATVDRWNPGDQVYRSIDGGATWKNVGDKVNRTSPDAPYISISSGGKPGAGNWIFNLRIDPFDSDHVMYVMGAGLWSTRNATKTEANQTTDWTYLVKGIEEGGAYEMVSPATGATLLSVFGDVGGFRNADLSIPSPNGNFQWGTGNGIDFAQSNPNKVVRTHMGGTNGATSKDNGVTWTAFPVSAPSRGNYDDHIAISPNGTNILWASYVYQQTTPPYYSKNDGASWTMSNVPNLGTAKYSLRSDRVNSDKFYLYNTTDGYMYVSTDGGANFTQGGMIQKWGGRVAVNPWVEGEVWVPVYDGLYYSTNSGKTFTKLSTFQNVVSVTLGKAAPGSPYATIFVQASMNGTWAYYRSTDHGATWVRINDDAHQYGYAGSSFIVADQGTYGRMYISTHCMGIAYGEITTPTGIVNHSQQQITANSAFPVRVTQSEGFHDIEIESRNPQSVKISILDIQGRTAATPVASRTATGSVHARWTHGNARPGAYILHVEGDHQTRNLVLNLLEP